MAPKHIFQTFQTFLILFSAGPPKPKMPRMILEFVNDDAEKWISNLVELV